MGRLRAGQVLWWARPGQKLLRVKILSFVPDTDFVTVSCVLNGATAFAKTDCLFQTKQAASVMSGRWRAERVLRALEG